MLVSFHDLVVLVSLIRHRTGKMMLAKAGCPPVNSVTNRFLTKIQGMYMKEGNMKRKNIWAFTLLAISFVWLLTWPDIAGAQSLPHLTPIPPRRSSAHAAALAPDSSSPWQPLTNQAPSGPNGIQIMMQATDGSIFVQAYDGQTWMKLTNSG
jgi:hypothetical protein